MSKCKAVLDGDKIIEIRVKTKVVNRHGEAKMQNLACHVKKGDPSK